MKHILIVGQFWIPTKMKRRPRHTMAIVDKSLLYGTGGERHFECGVSTFKRWITKECATVADVKSIPEFSL